jgi:hypothetical protein
VLTGRFSHALSSPSQHLLPVELLAPAVLLSPPCTALRRSVRTSCSGDRTPDTPAGGESPRPPCSPANPPPCRASDCKKGTLMLKPPRPICRRLCHFRPSLKTNTSPTGTIATNVTIQMSTANAVANSRRTPNSSVSTRIATTCTPPPIPGIWTIAPNDTNPIKISTSTIVKFKPRKAAARHQ